MPKQSAFCDRPRLPLLQRLAVLAATILAGLLACGALLAALGGPVTGALAAPAGVTRTYPGTFPCNTTLQFCIKGSFPGDTVLVLPGQYTESLTLNQAVNLTGVSSATVILHALANQRVLIVTGAAVNSSVIISGLTFAGGHAAGGDCPAGCGGAILITATAQPLLINLTISNSLADHFGGGLYADTDSPLVISGVAVLSNTSGSWGGGAYSSGDVTLSEGVFQNNQCSGAFCRGGGLWANNSLNATDAQFLGNTSSGNGGGASAGNATLNGGVFQNNHCTAAGCAGGGFNAGNLVLTSTQFLNNISKGDGGGLFAGGNVTLTGGLFQNNQCTASTCGGGGLFADRNLTATNTNFLGNTSMSGGGAKVGRDATLNGTLFQSNQCADNFCAGGGLFAVGNLTAANSNFMSNTSKGSGGGAKVNGNATLNGGSFLGNTSTGVGGGLDAVGNLTATNTQFVSNTSVLQGGGASAGNVTLSGSLFQNNRCTGATFPFFCSGGGLRALNLVATNSQFLGNTSTGGGGGAFSQFGIVTLNEDVFQNNQCVGTNCQGGGLFAENDLVVNDTLFLGNTAQRGAGLYHSGGSGLLVNDLFAANQASSHGDAVFLASPGSVSLLFTTVASPTVGAGSAIYVTSGTVGVTDTLIASYTVGIENAGGNVREDYNLFSGLGTPISGTLTIGGHSHLGAASFVNPAAGNFHIFVGSAAIDAGVDAGINFDIDGDPRPLGNGFDIGFDEANIRELFLPLIMR